MIEFEAFPKIPRLRREVAVTEKIDGTNACIQIMPISLMGEQGSPLPLAETRLSDGEVYGLWAQSRSHFVTPGKKDNYGFAGWVQRNFLELAQLGPGKHFGEWWGNGIQRGYEQGAKRFSLFNVARWQPGRDTPPSIVSVVPLLGYAQFHDIDALLDKLRTEGSVAAPGFMKPEGIVVWHSQSKQSYKVLLENDEIPKGLAESRSPV